MSSDHEVIELNMEYILVAELELHLKIYIDIYVLQTHARTYDIFFFYI